jgi:hypothetical protein
VRPRITLSLSILKLHCHSPVPAAKPTTQSETTRCAKCGYALYAPDPRARCPECGTSIAFMPHLAQRRRDNRLELCQIGYTLLLVVAILVAAANWPRGHLSHNPHDFKGTTVIGLLSLPLAFVGIVLSSMTPKREKKQFLLLESAAYILLGVLSIVS